MKYDFVDIGCGHTNVSVDTHGLDVNGLLVEPIKEYCDCLPHSNTVIIENSAVGKKNCKMKIKTLHPEGTVFNYVPISKMTSKEDLKRYSETQENKGGGESLKVDISSHQHQREVRVLTLKTLFQKYNITEIDQLKIDVEGMEEEILKQLIVLMRNKEININHVIIFEYHEKLSNLKKLDRLKLIIANEFGFTYRYQHLGWNHDVIMEKI